MATINLKSKTFDDQMDFVTSTMLALHLPSNIQDQVLNFMFKIENDPYHNNDLDKFLSLLNVPLRKQIQYQLYRPFLEEVPLLSKCTSVEKNFMIAKLRPVLFLPADVIVREGEKGEHLYFLGKGKVEVLLKIEKEGKLSEQTVRIMEDGDTFGEIALLTNLKRTATLKAIE